MLHFYALFILTTLPLSEAFFWSFFGCRCNSQVAPVYPCRGNSSSLEFTYPTGKLGCGIIYPLQTPQPTPTMKVLTELPDIGELYTLLLVDTSTQILHFGAVNLEASDVSDGIDLATVENVFSGYRGPSPPSFLSLFPGIYKTLFNYEFLLIGQSGPREVPQDVRNFGFDYQAFIGDDPVILNTFFSSGFCA